MTGLEQNAHHRPAILIGNDQYVPAGMLL